jgi:hypothetical protein
VPFLGFKIEQKKLAPPEIARSDLNRQECRNTARPGFDAGSFGHAKLCAGWRFHPEASQPDSSMLISAAGFPTAEDRYRQTADTYAPDINATNLQHA